MTKAFRIPARVASILNHRIAFSLQVIHAFQANQGLLLAGAVAYYVLLSILPMLILIVITLSHVIDQKELLETLRHALEHLVPGRSREIVLEMRAFLDNGAAVGWILFGTMLFFSSLAFKVMERAMAVIFSYRFASHRRHFLVSLLLPFGYILFIGALLLVGTYLFSDMSALSGVQFIVAGYAFSLHGVSAVALYLAGMLIEILLISSIYYFMPIGRLTASHALIGGATAGILWEIIRHGFTWYFNNFSKVGIVYGSLTTTIIVLLGFEIVATLVLFGAQVIAEYERIADDYSPQSEGDEGKKPIRYD